jgi:hypothetical protein
MCGNVWERVAEGYGLGGSFNTNFGGRPFILTDHIYEHAIRAEDRLPPQDDVGFRVALSAEL